MHVQVKHSLSGFFTVIDYQSESITITFLICNLCGSKQQMTQNVLVGIPGISHHRDRILRDHEDMYRRLWIDITEGQTQIILIDNIRRDLSRDNFTENSVRHILQSNWFLN